MRRLSQGQLARVVRGGSIEGEEDVERGLQIIANQTRAAAKRVNTQSVDEARIWLRGRLARAEGTPLQAAARAYMRCFETYVEWDATADHSEAGVQPEVNFMPEGIIRGRADLIFERGPDRVEARLLFTDELSMDRNAAELISLPSLRAVESRYGSGTVAFVEVWQLASGQQERVDAAAAEARDGDVRAVLSQYGLEK
jgi:hypothetical protein